MKPARFRAGDRLQLAESPPTREGVVGVYWGFEYRRVVDETGRGRRQKRVLTYYVLVWDLDYGLVSFRLTTWVPMQSNVYVNLHSYLKQYCTRKNIAFTAFKNSFEDIDLPDEELRRLLVSAGDLEALDDLARKWLQRLIPRLADEFQFSYSQVEFSHDLFIGERGLLRTAIERLILTNLPVFKRSTVFNLLDRDRVTVTRKHTEFTPRLINDRVMLLNYTARGLQVKIYPKGRQIRYELTYNKKFLDHLKRRKKTTGVDVRDFPSLYTHASQKMTRLHQLCKPVRVTDRTDLPVGFPTGSLAVKDADIQFMQEAIDRGIQEFKNRDLQQATGLTRNQLYYRLKHKFPGVFELQGRFWRLTRLGMKLLKEQLKGLGRTLGLWHRILTGWEGLTVG